MANLKIVVGYFAIALVFFLVACFIARYSGKLDDMPTGDRLISVTMYFVLAVIWPITAILGLGVLILSVGRGD